VVSIAKTEGKAVAPSALSEMMVRDGEADVVVAMDRTDDGAMLGHDGPPNACTWALEDGPARQNPPDAWSVVFRNRYRVQLCKVFQNHEHRAARYPLFWASGWAVCFDG
jgi:hypothetical protein